MKRRAYACFTLAFVALGCSSSGKSSQSLNERKSLAEALTQGVRFNHGKVKLGAIGKAGAGARKVKLAGVAGLDLEPSLESLMSLDVDNPYADNAADVTLMQFEDSDSHIEVPTKDVLAQADGGAVVDAGAVADAGAVGDAGAVADAGVSATDQLHLELSFDVAASICESLCNKRFSSQLVVAIVLADGSISAHQLRRVTLDCTHDGNPKQCATGGSGSKDAGAGGAGSDGGAAASDDAGHTSTGRGDAGASSGNLDAGSSSGGGSDSAVVANGNPPQIGPLTPVNVAEGATLTLSIDGSGFVAGAVAYVDGVAVNTSFVSDTSLQATIPATSTANAGSLAIYVENTPGDVTSRSNVLYLQVDPPAGAPVIYDYSPDNGVAGDTILIIASNLAGQTLTITDGKGNTLAPGALSTLAWPTAGTADTVEVVLPRGIETGPITVGNALGSFQGKIFTVGQNLTRLSGTTLDSSTQYNTSNWATASGGDNQLATSFFTAHGDCATLTTCTTKPWYRITFASDQTVARIAIRGNREYATGYDFLRGKFEVLDAADGVLWTGTYDLPAPDRDLDITLPSAVTSARKVKFSGLDDESDEPGLSELEVFAK